MAKRKTTEPGARNANEGHDSLQQKKARSSAKQFKSIPTPESTLKPKPEHITSPELSEDDDDNFRGFEDDEDELDMSESEPDEEEIDTKASLAVSDPAAAAEKTAKRQEQKSLRQERKLNKAHGHEIHALKQLWEKLRSKNASAADRKALVKEADEYCKGKYTDLVFRHDSSRIVQSVFKYADQNTRSAITDELRGSYVNLARSSYGKYLLVKMLHYGNAATRKQILDELHGHFRKLMRHREGAYVIEDAYRDYSTAAQRRQILREFYGPKFALFKDTDQDKEDLRAILAAHPEQKPFILKNLNDVITAAVNKGSIGFEIMHAAMLQYVRNIADSPAERETFIDLVADQISEMVHTSDGAQVASIVFGIATAKERKRLVKSLREFADKLIVDQYGCYVLCNVFRTVDDTVLLQKSFGPAIEDHLGELLVSKYGRRPLLYLICGLSQRHFAKDIQERFEEIDLLKKVTSKKDDEIRRQELLAAFGPLMLSKVEQDAEKLVQDDIGMQLVGELLTVRSGGRANEPGDETQRAAAVQAVVSAFAGDPSDTKHPVHKPVAGRTLKQLVKQDTEFAKALQAVVLPHLGSWALGDGTYVVVALAEQLKDPKVLKKLKGLGKELEAKKPRGYNILLELLAQK